MEILVGFYLPASVPITDSSPPGSPRHKPAKGHGHDNRTRWATHGRQPARTKEQVNRALVARRRLRRGRTRGGILVRVTNGRTIVTRVGNAIGVLIGFAGVADSVAIAILLPRIEDVRAVVRTIRYAVAISVDGRMDTGILDTVIGR